MNAEIASNLDQFHWHTLQPNQQRFIFKVDRKFHLAASPRRRIFRTKSLTRFIKYASPGRWPFSSILLLRYLVNGMLIQCYVQLSVLLKIHRGKKKSFPWKTWCIYRMYWVEGINHHYMSAPHASARFFLFSRGVKTKFFPFFSTSISRVKHLSRRH